jgi:hypothetical protein
VTVSCGPRWVSVSPSNVCVPGVTPTCATVAGTATFGSASSSGCTTASDRPFTGGGRLLRLSDDGSSDVAVTTLTARCTTGSAGSVSPRAAMPVVSEEPVSCGDPFEHWPTAVALDAWTPTRVPVGTGTSERSADVMSKLAPKSGTLSIVVGTLIGTFDGMPMSRVDSCAVAMARWAAGSAAGPSSVVLADAAPACSGLGRAGAVPPALAATHMAPAEFAVRGAPVGWPVRTLAAQFHPAAEAEEGSATPAATIAARASTDVRSQQTMSLASDRPGGCRA